MRCAAGPREDRRRSAHRERGTEADGSVRGAQVEERECRGPGFVDGEADEPGWPEECHRDPGKLDGAGAAAGGVDDVHQLRPEPRSRAGDPEPHRWIDRQPLDRGHGLDVPDSRHHLLRGDAASGAGIRLPDRSPSVRPPAPALPRSRERAAARSPRGRRASVRRCGRQGPPAHMSCPASPPTGSRARMPSAPAAAGSCTAAPPWSWVAPTRTARAADRLAAPRAVAPSPCGLPRKARAAGPEGGTGTGRRGGRPGAGQPPTRNVPPRPSCASTLATNAVSATACPSPAGADPRRNRAMDAGSVEVIYQTVRRPWAATAVMHLQPPAPTGGRVAGRGGIR